MLFDFEVLTNIYTGELDFCQHHPSCIAEIEHFPPRCTVNCVAVTVHANLSLYLHTSNMFTFDIFILGNKIIREAAIA